MLIIGIVFLVIQVVLLGYFYYYFNNKIKDLRGDFQLLSKSVDIAHEVSKGLGLKLIEQDKHLDQLTHSQAQFKPAGTGISDVAERFQRGENIDKMASELGLDDAEVQVMKMIREKAEESTD